ncbi:MAG: hypothetical protein ABI770_05090 [Sphingomicrobium sp.]
MLEATARDYPNCAEALQQQAARATVTEFENTGAGFFSTLSVEGDVPRLAPASPLDGASGSVNGVEDAMGFIVFLKGGQLSMIEGYCQAIESTVGIDFEEVTFDLKPWSEAGRIC